MCYIWNIAQRYLVLCPDTAFTDLQQNTITDPAPLHYYCCTTSKEPHKHINQNKQQQKYCTYTYIAQCIVEGEPIPETDRCTWSHIHTPNTHRYCTWKAFSITVYFSAAIGNVQKYVR
jgi:hypothetical protein